MQHGNGDDSQLNLAIINK